MANGAIFSPYSRALTLSTLAPAPVVAQKPSVWEIYRQFRPNQETETPIRSAVTGVRHNLEGAFIGALLGFIDGEFGGLDVRGKVPIDGVLAAFLFALSVRDAGTGDGFSSDLRAMSQACTTTLSYRKAKEWRQSTKEVASIPRNTAAQSDPLIEAAKRAGFLTGE